MIERFRVTDVTHYHKYRISGGGGERGEKKRRSEGEGGRKKREEKGERRTKEIEK